jgi:tripartite-type tricarboxylate transporter receptor subunit TctC
MSGRLLSHGNLPVGDVARWREAGCRPRSWLLAAAAILMTVLLIPSAPARAWEPTRGVEFIVPAGTGGGADQMARLIQSIVAKHSLMAQPLVVINKGGGAGADGFMYIKDANGDPHKIIITLSNLFTTPLATGVPFSWKDLTPVTMMALDQFVLWVNASKPYQNTKEFVDAVKAAGPLKIKMGGTGSKQEDQIITAAIQRSIGVKFIYIPFKGGGDVAVQLVGNHIDSSVNNPVEAVAQWRGGQLRPLCVLSSARLGVTEKITADRAWSDIPTCRADGIDVDYQMLRGIFMAPGVPAEARDYFHALMKKVRETPEWNDFLQKGAFDPKTLSGTEFDQWLAREAERHTVLMKEEGFIK